MTRHPAYIIASIALLWAAQLVFAIHELEHIGAHPDEQKICELCRAASGLNQITVDTPPSPSTRVSSSTISFCYSSRSQEQSYLISPARGPPSHSSV